MTFPQSTALLGGYTITITYTRPNAVGITQGYLVFVSPFAYTLLV